MSYTLQDVVSINPETGEGIDENGDGTGIYYDANGEPYQWPDDSGDTTIYGPPDETLQQKIDNFNAIYQDEANLTENNYETIIAIFNDISDHNYDECTAVQYNSLSTKVDAYRTMLDNVESGFSPHAATEDVVPSTPYTPAQAPSTSWYQLLKQDIQNVWNGAQTPATTTKPSTGTTKIWQPKKILFHIGKTAVTEEMAVEAGIGILAISWLSSIAGGGSKPKKRRR